MMGTPPRPGGRAEPRPVPLERGRAAGIVTGLLGFATGFAAAALVGMIVAPGHPLRYVGWAVGLAGIGVVGFFLRRGTVPLPEQPLWSPTGLRALALGTGLPAVQLMVGFYGLVVVGVVGNILVPVLGRS
jgi:MFS family permease